MTNAISFTAKPTGSKDPNGKEIYKKDFVIEGEELVLFTILCEVLHKNKQFKEMVRHALIFDDTHDHANCPFCREGGEN